MSKSIPLTMGMFAMVDDEDYDRLNKYRWHVSRKGITFYASRRTKGENGKRVNIKMHQEVIGKKVGFVPDHKNGNGLDNRRDNIRHVTSRQNSQNRHMNKKSKYPGVSPDKGKWRALIRLGKVKKHLGMFNDEYEAFLSYKNAVWVFTGQDVIGF